MRLADWIKLYLNVTENSEYMEFEHAMCEGKKSRKQKRIAEDTAFSQVIRLYLLLGQTKEGRIDYRKIGDRLLAERVMRETDDDLILIFDRMAAHGVINYDAWAAFNVVTTSNAEAQARMRTRYKERSENANAAKSAKAKKNQEGDRDGEP